MRKTIQQPLAALFLASLGAASPAFADSVTCKFFSGPPTWSSHCDAPAGDGAGVAANAQGHFIYFEVSPGARYEVHDIDTGARVAYGHAGITGHKQTVFGLYGFYKLNVSYDLGGWGTISNN